MAMACSPERINFFRVCRVIVDHIPDVLREVFKDEIKRQHGHTWDDTQQSGNWLVSGLAKRRGKKKPPIPKQLQLLTSGKTEDWDPTLLFLVLLYSNLNLLPTSKHRAVDGLRELRNTCYGHVSSGTVPAAELNNLFTEVEAAYNDLGVSPGRIQSLRAIETESIVDDATVQYYKKKLLSEFQEQKRRLDEHEESIADLTEDVKVLKSQHEQVAMEVESNKQENAAQIGNLQTKQDDFSQSLQSLATEEFGDVHKKQEELSQGLHDQTTRSTEQIADLHTMHVDLKNTLEASVSRIAKDQQAQIHQIQDQLVTFSKKQEEQDLKQKDTDSKLASTQAAVKDINVEVEKHGSQIEELQSQPPVMVNVQVLNVTQGVQLVPRGGMAPTDPHLTTMSSPPANFEYSFIVDGSRDQCQFKCSIKYSVDGRKERVDSGGYHATKAAAKEAAEREIMKKEASKGLHPRGAKPMKKTYKTMLKEYYEKKGMQGVKIRYETKEQPRHGIQATVYAPEIGSARGDFCRSKKEAENNAAFHVLQELGEDVQKS